MKMDANGKGLKHYGTNKKGSNIYAS